MVIPIFIIGLVSSIVTEILLLFPKLRETNARKKVTAFVISALIAIIYLISEGEYKGLESWVFLGAAISATFVVYKAVVQTVKAAISPKVLE